MFYINAQHSNVHVNSSHDGMQICVILKGSVDALRAAFRMLALVLKYSFATPIHIYTIS